MNILAQAGHYQCGECGNLLLFEARKISEREPWGIGVCDDQDLFSNITGELLRKGCPRAGIRMRVPIALLDCEIVKDDAPNILMGENG